MNKTATTASAAALALFVGAAASAQNSCVFFLPQNDLVVDDSGQGRPAAGDVDGDGDADLVVATRSGLVLFTNNGTGAFSGPVALDASREYRWVELADFDNDGDLDALAGSAHELRFFRNDGGSLGAGDPTGLAEPAHHMLIEDFDGDGLPDALVTHSPVGAAAPYTILLVENLGGGQFSVRETFPNAQQSPWSGAGDIDGDGRPDLITSTGGAGGTLQVQWNEGPAGFSAPSVFPVPVAIPGDPFTYPAPTGSVVGDFDGDGLNDIAIGALGRPGIESGVLWYRNLGGRTFAQPVRTTLNAQPWHLTSGDFDGDGRLDLVVGSAGGQLLGAVVLRNRPDADGGVQFVPVVTPVIGGFAWSSCVADFDGSGAADIAAINIDADRVSVATNITPQGVPCFPDTDEDLWVGAPDVAFVLNRWSRASAFTDFNADGTTDSRDLSTVLAFFGMSIAPEGFNRAARPAFDPAANEAATAAMLEAADADGDGHTTSTELAGYLGSR